MEKITEKTRRAVAGAQKPKIENKLDQLVEEHKLNPDFDHPGKDREEYDRQTSRELSNILGFGATMDPLAMVDDALPPASTTQASTPAPVKRGPGRPRKSESTPAKAPTTTKKTAAPSSIPGKERALLRRKVNAYFDRFPKKLQGVARPAANATAEHLKDVLAEITATLATGHEGDFLRGTVVQLAKAAEQSVPYWAPHVLPEEVVPFANLSYPVSYEKVVERALTSEGEAKDAMDELAIEWMGWMDSGPATRLGVALVMAAKEAAISNATLMAQHAAQPTPPSTPAAAGMEDRREEMKKKRVKKKEV